MWQNVDFQTFALELPVCWFMLRCHSLVHRSIIFVSFTKFSKMIASCNYSRSEFSVTLIKFAWRCFLWVALDKTFVLKNGETIFCQSGISLYSCPFFITENPWRVNLSLTRNTHPRTGFAMIPLHVHFTFSIYPTSINSSKFFLQQGGQP